MGALVEDDIIQNHKKKRKRSTLAREELPTLMRMVRESPGRGSIAAQREILLRYRRALAPRPRVLHDALTVVYQHGMPAHQREAVGVSERVLWGNCSCLGYIKARKQWPSVRRRITTSFLP